eukprot:SAG31_NODE_6485_length_2000_cov_1.926355_1_plen_621_part_10
MLALRSARVSIIAVVLGAIMLGAVCATESRANDGSPPPPSALGSAVNEELTFAHTRNNLLHLTRPRPARQGEQSPLTETIQYQHDVNGIDGSNSVVRYNVSHRLGIISLDFIPEVMHVSCDGLDITIALSNMAAAAGWAVGSPLVGSDAWDCMDVPVGETDQTEDGVARALPFYREIQALRVSPEAGLVHVSTKKLSLFQLIGGAVHVAHTPGPNPSKLSQTQRSTPSTASRGRRLQGSPTCNEDAGDCPDVLTLAPSCGAGLCDDCAQYTGTSCGECISHYTHHWVERLGEGFLGSNAPSLKDTGCSWGTDSQQCRSDAYAIDGGNWISRDTACDRCHSHSCDANAACPTTNDNHCDEGDGGCPPGSDQNDCDATRFQGCEAMSGTTCARCLGQAALGGGYCGWNPSTQDCQRSDLWYSDGYGRCDPCPEELLGNGQCDGPSGWTGPDDATGICGYGLDTDVDDQGNQCDGNINAQDPTWQQLRIGQQGWQDVGGSLHATGTVQVEAYAEIHMGYHLEIDFDFDPQSALGLPTGVNKVVASITGGFSAGVGFNIDATAISTGDLPLHCCGHDDSLWAGHLGNVRVMIGAVPVILNFDGKAKAKLRLDLGGHIQGSGHYNI